MRNYKQLNINKMDFLIFLISTILGYRVIRGWKIKANINKYIIIFFDLKIAQIHFLKF